MAFKLRSIFIVCLLRSVLGLPTGTISYTQDIKLSYEDGQWLCGTLMCPAETFGCRIQRVNNAEDINKLDTIFTCFDEDKQSMISSNTTTEMSKARIINIDVESYIEARSMYLTTYGSSGHEEAKGVVSPDGWEGLQESAAYNIKSIEDPEAPSE